MQIMSSGLRLLQREPLLVPGILKRVAHMLALGPGHAAVFIFMRRGAGTGTGGTCACFELFGAKHGHFNFAIWLLSPGDSYV